MAKATVESIKALLEEADLVDDPASLQSDVPLKDQGLDSLDGYNLFLSIEETFGIDVRDEDIAELGTIDALVAYVNERL